MTTDTESTNIRQLEFGDLGKSWLQHGLGRRCDSFGRFRVGGLDLPENLALVAQQDHAPAAAHPLGELRRAVFN